MSVPLVESYMRAHPEVRVTLDLSDRLVDLLNEGVDCAVRIGEMLDSSLVSSKLGEMQRAVIASPAYVASRGAPKSPADLASAQLPVARPAAWLAAYA
jgi:DNA-binding transcriptional LysR family regulator